MWEDNPHTTDVSILEHVVDISILDQKRARSLLLDSDSRDIKSTRTFIPRAGVDSRTTAAVLTYTRVGILDAFHRRGAQSAGTASSTSC